MPIEIRELHIKVNVTPGPGGQGSTSSDAPAGGRRPDPDVQRAGEDDLVARCVEQVMDLLRNRTER